MVSWSASVLTQIDLVGSDLLPTSRTNHRRVHALLRTDFPCVNHKRVYRLCRDANLAVRKCKKIRRAASVRVPLNLATSVNEVWSTDYVSDSLANGRRLKCLTVAVGTDNGQEFTS